MAGTLVRRELSRRVAVDLDPIEDEAGLEITDLKPDEPIDIGEDKVSLRLIEWAQMPTERTNLE